MQHPNGMDLPYYANGMTECDWSTETEPSTAPNGSYQEAARAACMHLNTSAPAVVPLPMEPSTVLMRRGLPEPPFHGCYDPSAWEQQLAIHRPYAVLFCAPRLPIGTDQSHLEPIGFRADTQCPLGI